MQPERDHSTKRRPLSRISWSIMQLSSLQNAGTQANKHNGQNLKWLPSVFRRPAQLAFKHCNSPEADSSLAAQPSARVAQDGRHSAAGYYQYRRASIFHSRSTRGRPLSVRGRRLIVRVDRAGVFRAVAVAGNRISAALMCVWSDGRRRRAKAGSAPP